MGILTRCYGRTRVLKLGPTCLIFFMWDFGFSIAGPKGQRGHGDWSFAIGIEIRMPRKAISLNILRKFGIRALVFR